MDRMRRGLAELGDAVREGAAARTRQNPRGLPMDEVSRRARAEGLGYDLDQRFYHATNRDFDGFSLREAGSGGGTGGVKERAVYVTDAPAVADSYLGGGHVRLSGAPDEGAVPLPAGDDVGRHYAEGSRTLPVVVRGMEDMPEWDMDRAMFSPQDTERALRGARAERAPGVIMDNYRDPGGVVAGPLGNGSQASRIVAVRDPRNLRSPHATFDPARAHEADLLAGVGGAGLAAGAAFEGLVGGGEEDGNRYEGGGLVGRAARLRELRRGVLDPYMDEMRQMLAERPIGISTSREAADGILRDGRFRSQFELGRSSGAYDPAYRAQLEERLLGMPRDAAPEVRPIYGALRSAVPEERPNNGNNWRLAPWEAGTPQYGDHLFLLQPETKQRSTYTLDDSFSFDYGRRRDPRVERAFPFGEVPPTGAMASESLRTLKVPGERMSREGALRIGESYGAIQDEVTPGRRLSLNHLRSPYIETQTRGPVGLDEVSAVITPRDLPQARFEALRERGLPVYTRDDVAADHDLQRHLGLRVGAGLTAGGAAAGALSGDGEEEGNRYEGGGLVERGVARAARAGLAEVEQALRPRAAARMERAAPRAGLTLEEAAAPRGLHLGDAAPLSTPPVRGAGDTAGDLFDHSRIEEVPNVPQVPLERYVPARGVPERVGDLVTDRRVRRQVLRTMDRGAELGGIGWYNVEPLRRAFIDELGEAEGQRRFMQYADALAATSPRNSIGSNVRTGSYYYGLMARGEPLPAKPEYPYGSLAQAGHRRNVQGLIDTGQWDVLKNPKPAAYAGNIQGNHMNVAVDTHASRLPAMSSRDPRFLEASIEEKVNGRDVIYRPREEFSAGRLRLRDALERPALWYTAPQRTEYGAMEQMYRELARQRGLSPAQGQSTAWAGGGGLTGLESEIDPLLRVHENRINLTAQARGEPRREVLRAMIRGERPLLGGAGVAVGAGAAGTLGDSDEGDGNRYATGGLAEAAPAGMAGAPGPQEEIASTQAAAARGIQQAHQMWAAAGSLMGSGGMSSAGREPAAHWGLVG